MYFSYMSVLDLCIIYNFTEYGESKIWCMLDVFFFKYARAFAFYFVFTVFSILLVFFSQLFLHVCARTCGLCVDFFFVSCRNKYKSWNDFLSRYWYGMRDRRRAWDMFSWKGEMHNYFRLSAKKKELFQFLSTAEQTYEKKKKRKKIIMILKIMNFFFLSLQLLTT